MAPDFNSKSKALVYMKIYHVAYEKCAFQFFGLLYNHFRKTWAGATHRNRQKLLSLFTSILAEYSLDEAPAERGRLD